MKSKIISSLIVSATFLARPAMSEPIMTLGSALDHVNKEPRTFVKLGADAQILNSTLTFSSGVSSKFDGDVNWESYDAVFSRYIKKMKLDLYSYNSKHMGVPESAFGSMVTLPTKFGGAFFGIEYITDSYNKPLFSGLFFNVKNVTISQSICWIIGEELGTLGTKSLIKTKGPNVIIDIFGVFNADKMVHLDSIIGFEWKL